MMDLTQEQVNHIIRGLQRSGFDTHIKNPTEFPLEVGTVIMMRGVPLYYLGEVVRWTNCFLTLKNAAWVQDTRNFEDLWKDPSSIEKFDYLPDAEVHIDLSGVSDFTLWPHEWPLQR